MMKLEKGLGYYKYTPPPSLRLGRGGAKKY